MISEYDKAHGSYLVTLMGHYIGNMKQANMEKELALLYKGVHRAVSRSCWRQRKHFIRYAKKSLIEFYRAQRQVF
jgi:hypothetical protein